VAKKIHFTKLDPCLSFGFFLKEAEDYNVFESFMVNNQRKFGDYWFFSTIETKKHLMGNYDLADDSKSSGGPSNSS
jgi:hypothetical protein